MSKSRKNKKTRKYQKRGRTQPVGEPDGMNEHRNELLAQNIIFRKTRKYQKRGRTQQGGQPDGMNKNESQHENIRYNELLNELKAQNINLDDMKLMTEYSTYINEIRFYVEQIKFYDFKGKGFRSDSGLQVVPDKYSTMIVEPSKRLYIHNLISATMKNMYEIERILDFWQYEKPFQSSTLEFLILSYVFSFVNIIYMNYEPPIYEKIKSLLLTKKTNALMCVFNDEGINEGINERLKQIIPNPLPLPKNRDELSILLNSLR